MIERQDCKGNPCGYPFCLQGDHKGRPYIIVQYVKL